MFYTHRIPLLLLVRYPVMTFYREQPSSRASFRNVPPVNFCHQPLLNCLPTQIGSIVFTFCCFIGLLQVAISPKKILDNKYALFFSWQNTTVQLVEIHTRSFFGRRKSESSYQVNSNLFNGFGGILHVVNEVDKQTFHTGLFTVHLF